MNIESFKKNHRKRKLVKIKCIENIDYPRLFFVCLFLNHLATSKVVLFLLVYNILNR